MGGKEGAAKKMQAKGKSSSHDPRSREVIKSLVFRRRTCRTSGKKGEWMIEGRGSPDLLEMSFALFSSLHPGIQFSLHSLSHRLSDDAVHPFYSARVKRCIVTRDERRRGWTLRDQQHPSISENHARRRESDCLPICHQICLNALSECTRA